MSIVPVDGRIAINPFHPVYYFDLAPVLARLKTLRHGLDRIDLMCEQCVRRHTPDELVFFRESGFFLVIRSCSGAAAETLAGAVNVALIELFFGTESLSDLPILFRAAEHAEIDDSGVMAAGTVLTPAVPARRPTSQFETEKTEADPLARLAQSGVPGYDGLRSGFLPMINLRRDAASIFMCGPVGRRRGETVFGPAALAGINPQDRPSLDQAMLDYSIGIARQIVPTRFAAAIGTSVSYETLSWARGRRIYQEALRGANVAENPFLLVKIEEVPAGTTVARLAEIVATVRPFVKRVFLELPDSETGLTFGGQIGAAGLIAALSRNATAAEAGRVAARLVRTSAAQSALPCLTGVDSSAMLAQVRAAGIRFAAGRVCEENVALDDSPPEDLMQRADAA